MTNFEINTPYTSQVPKTRSRLKRITKVDSWILTKLKLKGCTVGREGVKEK